MAFSQEQLPPIMETAIKEIQTRHGEVTHKEFSEILYKLRITSKDIRYYKKWLELSEHIKIKKHKIELNKDILNNIIILTCPECGYEWNYEGKAKRATCPFCKYRKKQIWVEVSSPI